MDQDDKNKKREELIDLPLASDPISVSKDEDKTSKPFKIRQETPAPVFKPAPAPEPLSEEEPAQQKAAPVAKPSDDGLRSSVPLPKGFLKKTKEASEAAPSKAPEKQVEAMPKGKTPQAQRIKVCPKCGQRNTNFYACDGCGLIFRNWRPDMEKQLFAGISPAVLEKVAKIWKEVEVDWNNEELHERFIKYCGEKSALPFATRSYRLYRGRNPEDERAAKSLERLKELAGSILTVSVEPSSNSMQRDSLSTGQLALVALVAVVVAVLTFIIFDYLMK